MGEDRTAGDGASTCPDHRASSGEIAEATATESEMLMCKLPPQAVALSAHAERRRLATPAGAQRLPPKSPGTTAALAAPRPGREHAGAELPGGVDQATLGPRRGSSFPQRAARPSAIGLKRALELELEPDLEVEDPRAAQAMRNARKAGRIEVLPDGFKVDGEYRLILGASFQWFATPEPLWEDGLKRLKAAGFTNVEMYVPWSQVEPREGEIDAAVLDKMERAIRLAAAKGFDITIRPGPYICNEYDGGGIPSWMRARASKRALPGDGQFNFRTPTQPWMYAVRRYFGAVNERLLPYLASRGGPICFYTVENEYDYFEWFHELDKVTRVDGKPERRLLEPLRTRKYFTELRDMVLDTGIDVPLTTCPGNAAVGGTGDVPGIIPLPNNYHGDKIEWRAHEIRRAMKEDHGGVYKDFPAGLTEAQRSPTAMKRAFMAGLSAVHLFAPLGTTRDGYKNTMFLDKYSIQREGIVEALRHPELGYFGSTLDYYGPIKPSGALRESFPALRRVRMFAETFKDQLRRGIRQRSGATGPRWPGERDDPRVVVRDGRVGAKEAFGHVNYWIDAGGGNYLIELVNEKNRPIQLDLGSVVVDGRAIPEFAPIRLMPEPLEVGDQLDAPGDQSSATVLVTGLPLTSGARLAYSTSEVLANREFRGRRLLFVQGEPGTRGELVLDRLNGAARVLHADGNFVVEDATEERLAVTFDHAPGTMLRLEVSPDAGAAGAAGAEAETGAEGAGRSAVPGAAGAGLAEAERIDILVTTRAQAGRTWFLEHAGKDVAVLGPDLLDEKPADGALRLDLELARSAGGAPQAIAVLADGPARLEGWTTVQYDPATGISRLERPQGPGPTPLPAPLPGTSRTCLDVREADPGFDDRDWTAWTGAPRSLDSLGIHEGLAWYRAEVDLDAETLAQADRLRIENASDFVGVYVNGHYLTTLAPAGTEIDNQHEDPRYAFPSLKPYLREGRNVIAFRTEIWGHGGFMQPMGRMPFTGARLPASSLDATKGLSGEATLGPVPLERWKVRAGLGGDRDDLPGAGAASATWTAGAVPAALSPGAVVWQETTFDARDVPENPELLAPIALELKGRSAAARVFLNGELIGRWLSDDDWLKRGTWSESFRGIWSFADQDRVLIPRERLAPGKNTLTIAFTDASARGEPGRVRCALTYLEDEVRTGVAGTLTV